LYRCGSWALGYDVNFGGFAWGFYYQWTGAAWVNVGACDFECPAGAADDLEIGIRLGLIGNITKFDYYVITEPGTGGATPDLPSATVQHDRAPNAGWVTYVVIPEFGTVIIPVVSTLFLVFILYRKRRNVGRKRKEVV